MILIYFVHDGYWIHHGLSGSAPKKCTQSRNFHFDINSPFQILFTRKLQTLFQQPAQRGGFVGSNLLAVFPPSPAFIYFARSTKTTLLRRLLFQKHKLELTTGIHAHSNENIASKVNSHFFILYRDYSNSLTLSNASELFWS